MFVGRGQTADDGHHGDTWSCSHSTDSLLLTRFYLRSQSHGRFDVLHSCTVWVKKIPMRFSDIFPNVWEFLEQILHTYHMFHSTLDYRFLSNCLQFWRSYTILNDTTQFTACSECPPSAETQAGIFWHFLQIVGNFSPNFTHLLYLPIYVNTIFYPITSNCVWQSYAILSMTTPIVHFNRWWTFLAWWWSRV